MARVKKAEPTAEAVAKELDKLQAVYDQLLVVSLASLMNSPSTDGWGFDAIGRQAAIAAEAAVSHRQKSKEWLAEVAWGSLV